MDQSHLQCREILAARRPSRASRSAASEAGGEIPVFGARQRRRLQHAVLRRSCFGVFQRLHRADEFSGHRRRARHRAPGGRRAMADGYGRKAKWTKARYSRSHFPEENAVNDFEAVEILLVEDSDADAELVVRALRKEQRGQQVRAACAMASRRWISYFARAPSPSARGGQPRLILLDLKMPRLGGIDVLRRLKADENQKSHPGRGAHLLRRGAGCHRELQARRQQLPGQAGRILRIHRRHHARPASTGPS